MLYHSFSENTKFIDVSSRNGSMLNDLLFCCCCFPIFCDGRCLPSCHLQICVHNDYRYLSIPYDRNDLSDGVLYDRLPSFRVRLQMNVLSNFTELNQIFCRTNLSRGILCCDRSCVIRPSCVHDLRGSLHISLRILRHGPHRRNWFSCHIRLL